MAWVAGPPLCREPQADSRHRWPLCREPRFGSRHSCVRGWSRLVVGPMSMPRAVDLALGTGLTSGPHQNLDSRGPTPLSRARSPGSRQRAYPGGHDIPQCRVYVDPGKSLERWKWFLNSLPRASAMHSAQDENSQHIVSLPRAMLSAQIYYLVKNNLKNSKQPRKFSKN
jgi:hypothetical protein